MELKNKTRDYLMFKPHESGFALKEKTFVPDEEVIFISPKDSETYRMKVTGGVNFHVDSLTLELAGLYRVKKDASVQKAEPFELPASRNSFELGDGSFECRLSGDVKKETDETKAYFKCTYYGDGVGLVNHQKVSVKTEEGDEFANKKKKGVFGKITGKKTTKTLLDGQSTKVKTQFEVPAEIVDMQFAPLFIHWNDAFRESMPDAIGPFERELKLDRAKTAGKN